MYIELMTINKNMAKTTTQTFKRGLASIRTPKHATQRFVAHGSTTRCTRNDRGGGLERGEGAKYMEESAQEIHGTQNNDLIEEEAIVSIHIEKYI